MTNLESLQSIFVNRAFLIPDYQRGYAWEVKQRKDLLNDLEDLEQVQSTVRHYTGTIVLHRGSHPAQNVRGQRFDIVDIVDGQQRITTLVILLLCISQRLRGFQDDAGAQEIAKTLEDGYICRSSVQGSLYRLKLNGGTDLFFRDHILGQAPIPDTTLPAHANLWNAKFEFQEYLTALCERAANDTDRIEICIALSQRITDRLGFVVYEVDNEAEVGVMFEVMNARGKALTQMEKVKNFCFILARVSVLLRMLLPRYHRKSMIHGASFLRLLSQQVRRVTKISFCATIGQYTLKRSGMKIKGVPAHSIFIAQSSIRLLSGEVNHRRNCLRESAII